MLVLYLDEKKHAYNLPMAWLFGHDATTKDMIYSFRQEQKETTRKRNNDDSSICQKSGKHQQQHKQKSLKQVRFLEPNSNTPIKPTATNIQSASNDNNSKASSDLWYSRQEIHAMRKASERFVQWYKQQLKKQSANNEPRGCSPITPPPEDCCSCGWWTKTSQNDITTTPSSCSSCSCFRGLEDWISTEVYLEKKARKATILHTVLQEQQRQVQKGFYNAETIRNRCSRTSQISMMLAYDLAQQDAAFVMAKSAGTTTTTTNNNNNSITSLPTIRAETVNKNNRLMQTSKSANDNRIRGRREAEEPPLPPPPFNQNNNHTRTTPSTIPNRSLSRRGVDECYPIPSPSLVEMMGEDGSHSVSTSATEPTVTTTTTTTKRVTLSDSSSVSSASFSSLDRLDGTGSRTTHDKKKTIKRTMANNNNDNNRRNLTSATSHVGRRGASFSSSQEQQHSSAYTCSRRSRNVMGSFSEVEKPQRRLPRGIDTPHCMPPPVPVVSIMTYNNNNANTNSSSSRTTNTSSQSSLPLSTNGSRAAPSRHSKEETTVTPPPTNAFGNTSAERDCRSNMERTAALPASATNSNALTDNTSIPNRTDHSFSKSSVSFESKSPSSLSSPVPSSVSKTKSRLEEYHYYSTLTPTSTTKQPQQETRANVLLSSSSTESTKPSSWIESSYLPQIPASPLSLSSPVKEGPRTKGKRTTDSDDEGDYEEDDGTEPTCSSSLSSISSQWSEESSLKSLKSVKNWNHKQKSILQTSSLLLSASKPSNKSRITASPSTPSSTKNIKKVMN